MGKLIVFREGITKNFDLLLLLIISAVLRFVGLGYSDFQGDEIKALFLTDGYNNTISFLLNQRKGPIQFLVTFLVKLVDPYYTNQFLVRFPFALAGFFAVYFFYKFVKLHTSSKIAFYASLFMATNGFFVAFSRIAQYQSFVILFSVLCLYYLTLAIQYADFRIKGVYLAALFWALAFLSHYDAVFIVPVVAGLLVLWLKQADMADKVKFKTLLAAGAIFIGLTLIFYLPFTVSISQSTKDYWFGRLSGDASSKQSSSYYLFTVYQPIYVIHFYIGLFAASVLTLLISLLPNKTRLHIAKIPSIQKILTCADALVRNTIKFAGIFTLLVWFILPFIFWEKLVYIPGTHIYTYILPSFVLIALGLYFVERCWHEFTTHLNFIKPNLIKSVGLIMLFGFIFLQSYAIYVDNTKEYPWEEESFLIWSLTKPTTSFHLSLFGFPYFRDWEGIGTFIKNYPEVKAYSTNERESISRHYIPLKKDTDMAGFFVFIKNPQSFTDQLVSQKVSYWASRHQPVYTMSKNGVGLVDIYLMQPGTLEELQQKGL